MYSTFFCKFSNNCLARSPTVKDNTIFKRRIKLVKTDIEFTSIHPCPLSIKQSSFSKLLLFFSIRIFLPCNKVAIPFYELARFLYRKSFLFFIGHFFYKETLHSFFLYHVFQVYYIS